MFVVNLDTNEIQDPIHVGFLSNSSQPLFGTQQSGSNMLTADNRTTTVLGFYTKYFWNKPNYGSTITIPIQVWRAMINSIYTIYRADYNPLAAYKEEDVLRD